MRRKPLLRRQPCVFPAREQRRQPVAFNGTHHPIDREHLRDQGMIVPEGSVTGLLEEFRIVKRHAAASRPNCAARAMPAARRSGC